jgi:hypothetical protein
MLVHDRIAAGEMPPPKQSTLAETERAAILGLLAPPLIDTANQNRDVVLRRLNRIEYENSVRDLFDVDVRVAHLLPSDNSTDGFDNIGEGLAVSAEAIEAYLDAADWVLDAVIGPQSPPQRIEHRTNLLEQKHWDGKPALDHVGTMFRRTNAGLIIFQSGYCPTNLLNFSRLRVPAGTYRGQFRVRAVQSQQPVTLRIYAGDTIVGRRERHLVGYFDVPPDRWTTVEFEDRLVEPGGTYQPVCYGTSDIRKNADTYDGPGIEIGEIIIEGPLEPWPPISRQQVLGDVDLQTGTIDDIRQILERVVPRAFRRPVSPQRIDSLVTLARRDMDQGADFQTALRLSLKSMLCAPEFLFLEEPLTRSPSDTGGAVRDDGSIEQAQTIDQFALASRLSYFLWSSMPDPILWTLAAEGRLAEPEILRQQIERLLGDPRASALTTHFTGQWLRLREIDFTSPDAALYPEFDELLRISMVEETHRFFQSILDDDLSVLNFIDSDFTFLNQRLAEHYGIPAVTGQTIRRVELPSDSVRGGVLTQASVLKVTANGTTTSPVLRGAWVLENILGRSVPPPPAGVSAVEPDIRGAVTLRDQIELHAQSESCGVCHQHIDPPGFALESFDVIGGYRQRYRTLGDGPRPQYKQDPHTFAWIRWRYGLQVDATGVTSTGRSFQGIDQYKQILLDNPDDFLKALTTKLATYAIGRRMTFADRAEIEKISTTVAEEGYGLRTMVHSIVQSPLFIRP